MKFENALAVEKQASWTLYLMENKDPRGFIFWKHYHDSKICPAPVVSYRVVTKTDAQDLWFSLTREKVVL